GTPSWASGSSRSTTVAPTPCSRAWRRPSWSSPPASSSSSWPTPAASRASASRPGWAAEMDLLLLGTKGGPRISAAGPGPSQLLEHDGRRLLVDTGEGVVHQLVRAGIDPATVCDVLITHHHCDHNVALGNVLMANWVQGGDRPIRVYGPPPLREIVGHLLAAHSYDIAPRVADEGRADLRALSEDGARGGRGTPHHRRRV